MKKKSHSKNSKTHALAKPHVFEIFVEWISTFEPLREPPTQQEFSELHAVSQHTLSVWKQRPEFWDKVKEKWKAWGLERTKNVMEKFYRRVIQSGDSQDIKLWFQYFLDWTEKHKMDVDVKKLSVHKILIDINKKIESGDDLKEIPTEIAEDAELVQDQGQAKADNKPKI
jgi:hypothetical protein